MAGRQKQSRCLQPNNVQFFQYLADLRTIKNRRGYFTNDVLGIVHDPKERLQKVIDKRPKAPAYTVMSSFCRNNFKAELQCWVRYKFDHDPKTKFVVERAAYVPTLEELYGKDEEEQQYSMIAFLFYIFRPPVPISLYLYLLSMCVFTSPNILSRAITSNLNFVIRLYLYVSCSWLCFVPWLCFIDNIIYLIALINVLREIEVLFIASKSQGSITQYKAYDPNEAYIYNLTRQTSIECSNKFQANTISF